MRWTLFVVALALGLVLDLGSKNVAFAAVPRVGESREVTSWLSITHAENPGASFGLLPGQQPWFMLMTIFAIVAVTYGVHSARRRARLLPVVLGLVLAGVLGNFRDRIVLGIVRDFIHVHAPAGGGLSALLRRLLGRDDWYVFNVADCFIVLGAGALAVLLGRERPAARPGGPTPRPPAGPAAPAPCPPAGDPV